MCNFCGKEQYYLSLVSDDKTLNLGHAIEFQRPAKGCSHSLAMRKVMGYDAGE